MDSNWIIWFILFFCIILPMLRRKKTAMTMQVLKKKKAKMTKEERLKMYELVSRFVGKEVIITVMNSETAGVTGVVTEVKDNWLVVDTKGNGLDAVNIDYITRIREYPRKENGKKKTIF